MKKIKLNSKVRLPDGRTGIVSVIEDKKAGVVVKTQGLWQLVWYPISLLEVVK